MCSSNSIILMTYLYCAYRKWALNLYEELSKEFNDMILIKNQKKLTLKTVNRINPKYIFFPDWSWKVPKEIIANFKCVCFHESDLPKFRGGSPIQNQIIRGINNTKTTAFFMNEGIDEGDIILKKNLSLKGSLEEILKRMQKNDHIMIREIIKGKYKIKKQSGKISYYKRRKPEESELKSLNYSKKYIYNIIRMLEDPYPNAFLKIGKRKIIFNKAHYNGKKLKIEGEIV